MRTTLNVDDAVLDEVVKLTGEKNKSKAVNKALEEYLRRRRIAELKEMAGKIDLVDNLKELEELELKELEQMRW
ncbi:MAG: type II toxin-antitoxin system VapB family antitoxin [Chloroflexi bacterium]|nr:type II toxin-antitoxin system VapB family antitoxin [Chloroflexota bacterium]